MNRKFLGFSLSNLIQMWRQTLNQGAFRRNYA
ncbi:hypothetical protein T05_454 [Trichinella murrelli]|uniref:Uncharacterized protein n=1 Tax=Trichinella murrelli TaxID=144512 RepID=A0A0V0SRB1_9BILA|nr:hypothetical protein T05_454 [Trichinella murrelli]